MALPRTTFRFYGTITIWLAILLAGCQSSTGTQAQSSAGTRQPPATILIVRHAEKPGNGESSLSAAGAVRAGLLPQVFSGARPDLPTPQALFAAHVSPHSDRSVETLTPLAQALHLSIDHGFTDRQYLALAAELLSGKYAGKVVLIAWHRGSIPQLAAALGATPPYDPWPKEQFDRVWRIDYVNGKATLRDLPYAVMPGDSR